MKKIYFLLFLSVVSAQLFSQNYTVLGNASQMSQCNCYQLTPNSGGQAGAIFQNNTIDLNNSFDFTFSNFFGCNGASGADGEAFVLTTNPNGLGNQGEGLGYGGSNQPCSFAIEFDTWTNGDHNDPSYDHTAYESGGSVNHNISGPVSALSSGSNLDNCQWHTIRIVWDAATQTMYDYVDGSLRISQALPGFVSGFLCGNPIVNWGWTGSTGGGWNLQQVCMKSTSSWVAGTNYQSCNPSIQFNDVSTSNVGSVQSWKWTFGDGTTSNLQNPSHTYTDTGTFNATLIITDVSGCADTFSHPVHIAPPITLTPTVVNPACNGAQTGSISLAESGGLGTSAGHGGFIYNWNNNGYGPQLNGIGAGTYTVTCTDGICTASGQYTLNQPTPVTATTSSTAANCGLSNGSCTITISGGTPPYQNITWAGVSGTTVGNTTTVSGFPAGTYIANFNDANGCSALLQYTATVAGLPCGITSTTSQTNVTCFGGNNGSVTLTVTGGAPPATITWTNSGGTTVGTGATVNNLPAGTYTYSYSDANAGNAFTGALTLTQPGAAIVVTMSTSNVSCAGSSDGKAVASITSGGTGPFSYNWSNGQSGNPVVNNLTVGPISVTVTDANGCTATASGTISSVPALQISITTTDNGCHQYNNGSATATITGGTQPYRYNWSNISSAPTDLSLGGGTYTVTVTDSNSCSITGSATIAQSPPFINTIDSTNVKCHGDSTGAINVNSSGGASPYTYSWSSDTIGNINPSLVGASLTNLKAGEYLLTVTDAHGCTFFDSTFLRQPLTAVTITTSKTDVTCYNANNGIIIITLSGGTPLYTYQGLTVPPGTDTIQNLPPGIYNASVTDAVGCTATAADTINSPLADSLVLTHTDNTCNGGHAGTATANFVNATGSVSYNWSNAATGATISNLDSATYNVTATDANQCSLTGTTTISQPPPVAMTMAVADPPCYGGKGFITATPNGGNAPFVYVWSGGGSSSATDSLTIGNYTVSSTDVNSCLQTAAFTVNQPAAMNLQATKTDVLCYGANTGSITLTPSGGTGPNYTYSWQPNVSAANSSNTLTAGNYNITVTDQAGCTKDTLLTINQPAQPLSATYVVANVACFNGSNGSINISTTGGTPNYTYTWVPNVSAGSSAANLAAGPYAVTITDQNGCSVDSSFTLTQPATALALDSSHTNLTCFGSSDGAAYVTATGGTSPYTYVWTPGTSTVDSSTGLAAGSYAVVVTDNNFCTATLPYVLTQPAQIVTTGTPVNVLCNGLSTGSVTITASGGAGGFTYAWNPNVSTSTTASNLAAGTYVVTVTDANGCTTTQSTTVSQAAAFAISSATTTVQCYGESNGSITVSVSGGTPPYNYLATDGTTPYNSTTGLFGNVPAGNYTIAVTDQNGCPDTTTAVVNQPAQITDVLNFASPACSYLSNGVISITAQGGSPAYTFAATGQNNNSSGLFTGLAAGDYGVTITDNNGCSITDAATLVKPDSVEISVAPVSGEVKLGDTLQLVTTTNQTGNITYAWSPSFGLSCYDCPNPVFNGVYSQPYTVVVTTDSGCTAGFNFKVTVLPNYDYFIPNAFTPNGDGKDDYWQIYGNTAAIKQLQVMVFDRIGEKVFESNDINFKWDGTFKNQPAQIGVYVYAIKLVWLDNRSDDTIKGSITLLK